MISFYHLVFSAGSNLLYFLFWSLYLKKLIARIIWGLKRQFSFLLLELEDTIKVSSAEAIGLRASLLLAHPFSQGIALFQTLQWVGNDFWSLSFCPRRLPKPQLSSTAISLNRQIPSRQKELLVLGLIWISHLS